MDKAMSTLQVCPLHTIYPPFFNSTKQYTTVRLDKNIASPAGMHLLTLDTFSTRNRKVWGPLGEHHRQTMNLACPDLPLNEELI